MYRCSFTKTFWILRCREVRAPNLIHDTNSMLFRQPRFHLTLHLSCVWNSAMFPIMFHKLFNANSTVFLFFSFFKCLFVTSYTLHLTLFTSTLLYSEVLFLLLFFYLGALFYKKKKRKKYLQKIIKNMGNRSINRQVYN